jgi:hypothetical protein
MADIEHAIQIAAKPETIYPLFATAGGFGKWWATDIVEEGGAVELGFFNRATTYRLRLYANHPPSETEWVCDTGDEWNGTHLRFRIEAGKSGSVLRFSHSGWRGETDYFVMCNTTWGELMYRLKAVAEGKTASPLFSREGLGY